jgi:hypothetical protein
MVHLDSLCNAIKASWGKRLLDVNNTGSWKKLLARNLPKSLSANFWEGNLKYEDCQRLPISPFFKEIVQSWTKLNFCEPKTHCDILNQSIFHNHYIKIDGKPIHYSNWISHGISRVRDLMGNAGNFLTWREFNDLHQLDVNFLSFASVLSAIPVAWKRGIQGINSELCDCETHPSCYTQLMNANRPCNFLYKELVKLVFIKPTRVQSQWHTDLGVTWEFNEWKRVYESNKKALISSKLRSFNYRYLHRTLVFNKLLFKIGKVESSQCTFCNEHEESFVHLFAECRVTENCFKELQEWLLSEGTIVTKQQFLLDYQLNSEQELFRMKICILFRHFLYTCKCKQQILKLSDFKRYVVSIKETEKIIAEKNQKEILHDKVWSFLPPLVVHM